MHITVKSVYCSVLGVTHNNCVAECTLPQCVGLYVMAGDARQEPN